MIKDISTEDLHDTIIACLCVAVGLPKFTLKDASPTQIDELENKVKEKWPNKIKKVSDVIELALKDAYENGYNDGWKV